MCIRDRFNYRIDEIRAALGIEQLARIGEFNTARARLAARYRAFGFAEHGLQVPYSTWRGESAFHLAPLVAGSRDQRDRLRNALQQDRIQTSIHYPAIHRFSSYAGAGSLPVAEEIADRVLTLPLHPGLAESQVDEVCAAIAHAVESS